MKKSILFIVTATLITAGFAGIAMAEQIEIADKAKLTLVPCTVCMEDQDETKIEVEGPQKKVSRLSSIAKEIECSDIQRKLTVSYLNEALATIRKQSDQILNEPSVFDGIVWNENEKYHWKNYVGKVVSVQSTACARVDFEKYFIEVSHSSLAVEIKKEEQDMERIEPNLLQVIVKNTKSGKIVDSVFLFSVQESSQVKSSCSIKLIADVDDDGEHELVSECVGWETFGTGYYKLINGKLKELSVYKNLEEDIENEENAESQVK